MDNMTKEEFLSKLEGTRRLSDLEDAKFIDSGSYAINRIISGRYTGGYPIGAISQIRGNSSTGKTLFATSLIKEAQRLGYPCKLMDAENAFSKSFAVQLGIDPTTLMYSTPETVESAFDDFEKTIASIRGDIKDKPIVIVLDSLAVLPCKEELLSDKDRAKGLSNYDSNPMQGALRAKAIGTCLRRANPLSRKYNVCFVIINQMRSKVGVIFGNPDTVASGGRSLEFYLSVDLHTTSNKSSDVIKGENDKAVGIEGSIECKKNKCSIPFGKCDFKVKFDEGLDRYHGLMDLMVSDGAKIEKVNDKGRYKIGNTSFTRNTFVEVLLDKNNLDTQPLRDLLGEEKENEVRK